MHKIIYGEKEIVYTITRKQVKNINLRVNPDLEVLVSANQDVPLEVIQEFVYSKARWIEQNLDYYKKTEAISQGEKEYVNGESFRYLGKQYRLKVFEASEERVEYFRGYIHLYTKDLQDCHKKEELMETWYKERSQLIFKESLDRMYELVKSYNIVYPTLAVRKMNRRWGSCYPDKGQVLINSELIKAPKDCINYVVLHELIHFKYPHHKREFYQMLDILMPDWREKKKILDEVVVREL